MSSDLALPDDGRESVESFRRLLEAASGPSVPESPVVLTDRLVGPRAGELLRRCALPHEFDSALLAWLGELDAREADERYAQFVDLSLMQIGDTQLAMHERWRGPLWRWWLDPVRRPSFAALSERLVQWFTRPASLTGEDPAERRRMFHLIGCRHDEGVQEFERLFRMARHRRRFSECSLLLQLVHEYDPLMSPEELVRLSYHEGKTAIDMRQWERALPILHGVAESAAASARLRVNAEARIGHALRQLQRNEEAFVVLKDALTRAVAPSEASTSRWRVLYELGETHRDLGRVDMAASTLSEALGLVNDTDGEADRAGLLNSLGTVQLKLRDFEEAVASFNASLELLRRRGDALRPGMVLNNLGLAQLERCDWGAAESAFAQSLQSKRAAGDVIGVATTLLNLSRTHAAQGRFGDAVTTAVEAAALFERAGDQRGRALAAQTMERFAARKPGTSPATALGRKRITWWGWGLMMLSVLLVLLAVATL